MKSQPNISIISKKTNYEKRLVQEVRLENEEIITNPAQVNKEIEAFYRNMKMSDAAKFMVSLSVDVHDGRDRLVALKRQGMSTCRNKQLAGLVEMMTFSTVIRNNVYSIYPDASPAMRPLFHGVINPRIAWGASRTCYIMWSRCTSFDNDGVFQPDHFVTLSEVHKEERRAKSYAQIILGNNQRLPEQLMDE